MRAICIKDWVCGRLVAEWMWGFQGVRWMAASRGGATPKVTSFNHDASAGAALASSLRARPEHGAAGRLSPELPGQAARL